MSFGSPLDEGQLDEARARELICEIGRRLWQRQYVEGNAGNISYRLAGGRILATPTMISKGFMQPEDMVVLDAEGNQLSGHRGKTSEILVHLKILAARPDLRSVVHCHPPHATAFAMTRHDVPSGIHPEAELFLGKVPIAPYQTPGSQAVADSLTPWIKDSEVFLLRNHGSVTAGTGLLDAYFKTEIIDAYCRLLILSASLGQTRRLTGAQLAELDALKGNFSTKSPTPLESVVLPGTTGPGVPPPGSSAGGSPSGGSSGALGSLSPEAIEAISEAVVRRLREKP